MSMNAQSNAQSSNPGGGVAQDQPTVFVAAVVITCRGRVLATYNPKWGSFTLPMTKLRPGERWIVGATRAACECTGKLFSVSHYSNRLQEGHVDDAVWSAPVGVSRTGAVMQGDRDGADKVYLFQVFWLDVDKEFALPPGIRGIWLTVDDFLNYSLQPISKTARFLIEGLSTTAKIQGKTFPDRTIEWPYTRKSEGAWALVTRVNNGERQWLTRWNKNWNSYGPLGGHKRETETFRECLLRELDEELGQQLAAGATVQTEPRGHLEYEDYSDGARRLTDYTMEVFDVVFNDMAERQMHANPHNTRWVNASEIRNKQCERIDKPVSRTMERLLDMVGWD